MKIVEIKEKSVWEDFLLNCKEKTFLQSWNWGEFQQRMGNKIWRLGVFNNGYPISIILAVKIRARRGTFLLIQHNVCFSEMLLKKLKEIAKEENCSFIRMAPLLDRNKENKKLFKDLGFKKAPMHASAYEATWKLDLTPPEDALLAQMRKTTRYLIRQAEKNPDVVIEKSEKSSDLAIYQKLNKAIASRQHFTPFSDEYLKNEFDIFTDDGQAQLFLGKYKRETAAAALVIFWQGTGFYHQAASLPQFAKFSVPYLLQWAAIKEAKKRGCRAYDFWGYVDPKSRHPWAGPTLFKMGFGGEVHQYIETQDLPLSWKYRPIHFFEALRRIKRGL